MLTVRKSDERDHANHGWRMRMIVYGNSGGANLSMFWHGGGHELGDDDVAAAKAWLSDAVRKRLAA